MISRRVFLASTAGAVLASTSRFALSQSENFSSAVDLVVSKRVWTDPNVFSDLYRMSWVTWELRQVYANSFSEITGIENDNFGGYRDLLVQSLGESPETGLEKNVQIAESLLNNHAEEVADIFLSGANSSGDAFLAWLESMGIVPGSRLSADIVNAQAFFSLFDLARLYRNEGVPERDECWWPYPFC